MELDTSSLQPMMNVPPLFAGQHTPKRPSSRQPRSTASERPAPPKSDGTANKPSIELVLYVSSVSPHSVAALRNLRRTLAQYAGDAVRLTVCDLSKDPSLAERDGVHFTPSLVAAGRGPRTWIVGHLGNPQVLQAFLESALEPKQ
jgi:KaiB-like protein